MNKFIVVTFPTEDKAYQGVRALKELDAEGSLTLYGMEVVARDAAGVLKVKQAADAGPIGMGLGGLLGGVVGLIGGPVGAMVGLAGGSLMGGIGDLVNSGVSSSFIKEASRRLAPGKTALIAEVDETWITPLDTRMEALGADVLRESSADVEDEYHAAQIAARKAELAELKAEVAQAAHDRRARLRANIDDASARLQAAVEQAEKRLELRQQATSAKIEALSQRVEARKAEDETATQQRISELREEYTQRKAKLVQARELARESDKVALEALRP